MLEKLYEAHDEYGQALGITAPVETDESMTLREALDEFIDALRVFVVRTTGMMSKKDAKRTEIAEQLLAPIMAWETPGTRGKVAEAPTEAPAEPPTPADPTPQVSPQ
jgi:hypothetical protein